MSLKVMLVMGSDSDLPVLQKAFDVLNELGIAYEAHVASAHRTPEKAVQLARTAREKGFGISVRSQEPMVQ